MSIKGNNMPNNNVFHTPDSVKQIVPIIITDEMISEINKNIEIMIKNNMADKIVCEIPKTQMLIVYEIMREMCKSGWRVSQEPTFQAINIIVENPHYKGLPQNED
jgi:hypothetical protein